MKPEIDAIISMASIGDGAFVSSPDMEKFLCELLLDSTQPISERFRALFSLRNLKGPSPRDALILGQSMLILFYPSFSFSPMFSNGFLKKCRWIVSFCTILFGVLLCMSTVEVIFVRDGRRKQRVLNA